MSTPFSSALSAPFTIGIQSLNRRQALANALLQQGLTAPQTQKLGPMASPVSPVAVLGKLAQTYAGANMENRITQQEKGLAQNYGKRLGAMLGGLFGTSAPTTPPTTPTAPIPLTPSPQNTPNAPTTTNGNMRPVTIPPATTAGPGIAQGNGVTAYGTQPAAAPTQSGLRLPPGMTPQQMVRLMLVDPTAASGLLGAMYKPSQLAILMRESGIDPNSPQGRYLQQQYLVKTAMPPPIRIYQGGGVWQPGPGPHGGKMVYQMPKLTTYTDASGKTVTGYSLPNGHFTPLNVPSSSDTASAPNNAANLWATIPKLSQPQGIGQTTFHSALMHQEADEANDLAKQYSEGANVANQRMAYNNQALSLVDQADTGPGSSFIASIKNVLTSRFHIPEQDFNKTPSANIALNKDLVNAALQRGRQMFGSRFTQSEVGIMLGKAAPSAEQTKAAIKFLLKSDNAGLQYQIKQASDFGKYIQMGGDPNQFAGWYSKHFPMSPAVMSVRFPYDRSQGSQSGAPVHITGDADYAKLPSGTEYIDPNGVLRRKR